MPFSTSKALVQLVKSLGTQNWIHWCEWHVRVVNMLKKLIFSLLLSGMQVVDRIYSGYGEKPSQGLIQQKGNEYLIDKFPKLTYITVATSA